MALEIIRKTIDEIDAEMRVLFERRMDCIKAVAEYKYNNDDEIFDQNREERVKEKNLSQLKNKEYAMAYEGFIQELLDSSKVFQKQWINDQKQNKISGNG
ncbi:chorismate mutase [Acetobacterium paludosum]|uniref:Chorismate mutase n=1 Tax=Acetobacterium paludosum TaxID=52693 RepID=A0A923HTY5_9FIRM|nr:chorismate mutase [Acetobacterium paludosum]MBC3887215.1 chorismate mutase [Acetobacterium paludosum]